MSNHPTGESRQRGQSSGGAGRRVQQGGNKLGKPSDEEIMRILRGADSVIGTAGRTMLAKILKGSKDKKVLQFSQDMELRQNPAYGSLSHYTLVEITEKIDWMIRHDYLALEYNWKLPVIVFTEMGWEVEREERANEFLREWDAWIENGTPVVSMEYLKGRNRGMITLFLQKVMATNDAKYLPLLRQWEPVDFQKVRAMIREVIAHLEKSGR
ncbi:RQC-minor-1 family DNA-binding protein [Alicyclobacillus sp. ALC3]|uniref:RQC-minor-1 family DNA-binding protein n=1 Tax=Alicyclobacillus sp. ALC3 TaxID=2796143 RepID=UPI002379C4CF|nr:RQC-minor-1 family DNA-binding protein [Alicyclobacillus sp. ALC3]WDL95343.1 RQC domain protein [Alicyclobacillus sp. ALC3]